MTGVRQLALPGADVRYIESWLDADSSQSALTRLLSEVTYSQHRVRMFGRELPAPRLSAWVGDPDAVYTYSRVRYQPLPWTPTLTELRDRLLAEFGVRFNSVLVNRYRDGSDSMGWHADDEAELGPEPVIASISLGATRQMRFRSRPASNRVSLALTLEHGSLLWMAGATQHNYQHAILKTNAEVGERINLTFRVLAAS